LESSASTADIVVGTGKLFAPINVEHFGAGGWLDGTITLGFGAIRLSRGMTFQPDAAPGEWYHIRYPDGPNGIEPPLLSHPADELRPFFLSDDPDPLHPDPSVLRDIAHLHYAAVIRIRENATTVSLAPQTLTVDLISHDVSGIEIGRVEGLIMSRVEGDDGDPAHLVYHSDLLTPVIFVDTDIETSDYPGLVIVRVSVGGGVMIVPALR